VVRAAADALFLAYQSGSAERVQAVVQVREVANNMNKLLFDAEQGQIVLAIC
jgi:hypothetical protein